MSAIDDGPNSLKIWVPATLRNVMSVADIIAKERALAADITTCCHNRLLITLSKTSNYNKVITLPSNT